MPLGFSFTKNGGGWFSTWVLDCLHIFFSFFFFFLPLLLQFISGVFFGFFGRVCIMSLVMRKYPFFSGFDRCCFNMRVSVAAFFSCYWLSEGAIACMVD